MGSAALKKLLQPHHIIFLCIILFALYIRTYNLATTPPGFFCDEASIGYDAYSILTTGRDMHGKFLPVFFQSLDDFKHGLFIYSSVPFVGLFGLSEFAVRITSVFFGLITVVVLYLVGRDHYGKWIGLAAAGFAAILPWLIHYNRIGFELNSYAAFFVLSIYLWSKIPKNAHYIIPAYVILGLSFYTYQPAKLIMALFGIALHILLWKILWKQRKYTVIGLMLCVTLLIPLVMSFLTGEAFARFNQVSILSKQLPLFEMILLLLKNYSNQLSPQYLFIEGDPTFINRHLTKGLTPLYWVMAPCIVLGLAYLIKTYKTLFSKIILVWLIIYPLGGTVIADGPYSSRSIIGAPLFALLASLGFFVLYKIFTKKKLVYIGVYIIFSLFLLIQTISFGRFYFTEYKLVSADFWGWQYGPKKIINYFVLHEKNYDELYMMGEFNRPDIFLKFYAPTSCKNCQIGSPDTHYNSLKKQLFAITPQYLENNPYIQFVTQETVYYPNGNIAFVIGEVRTPSL